MGNWHKGWRSDQNDPTVSEVVSGWSEQKSRAWALFIPLLGFALVGVATGIMAEAPRRQSAGEWVALAAANLAAFGVWAAIYLTARRRHRPAGAWVPANECDWRTHRVTTLAGISFGAWAIAPVVAYLVGVAIGGFAGVKPGL